MGSSFGLAYNLFMQEKNPRETTALPSAEPRAASDLRGSGGTHTDNEQPAKDRSVILVVDDSADNVAILSLDLQQAGYRVVTATNGEEAVTVASAILPNLILMDISMPRLDGLGATRRIREIEALREVPIIALTAFDTDGFKRAAYDVGVSGYLTKPIDFARMHQLIARQLVPGTVDSMLHR